jgi:membrane protein
MKRSLRKFYGLVREIVSVWIDGNASSNGAAVAYYTIFAIAPIFIFALALAGFVFGPKAAQRELFGQLSSLVGSAGGEAIQATVAAADRPRASVLATAFALITLFVGAGSVFVQLQSSLNAIWNVRPKPGSGLRHFIKNRLVSFAMLLGIGFLLLVSLVISAALAAAGKFMSQVMPAEEMIWHVADFAVSLCLVTVLFAMIFKILPDARIAWRDVWIGAVITALLFGLGKLLLGFYLGRSTFASAYGAAGSLVVLLIWVYYSVQILLFGAAVARVWANRYGSHVKPVPGAQFVSKPPTSS